MACMEATSLRYGIEKVQGPSVRTLRRPLKVAVGVLAIGALIFFISVTVQGFGTNGEMPWALDGSLVGQRGDTTKGVRSMQTVSPVDMQPQEQPQEQPKQQQTQQTPQEKPGHQSEFLKANVSIHDSASLDPIQLDMTKRYTNNPTPMGSNPSPQGPIPLAPPSRSSKRRTVEGKHGKGSKDPKDGGYRGIVGTDSNAMMELDLGPSRHTCVLTDSCPEPFISNQEVLIPAIPHPSSCTSYVSIQPDVQGLGHAHANRDTALQVALALANESVCYAHPAIHARHVHNPKKWEHFLGFEKGWRFQGDILHNASITQVQLTEVSSLEHLVADIRGRLHPNMVFLLPFHQDTASHCKTAGIWRRLYYLKRAKDPADLLINPEHYNVVLHVRRGDLQNNVGENRRIKPVAYFQYILKRILTLIGNTTRQIDVHVFSLGLKNLGNALQRDLPGSEVHINSPHGTTFHTFLSADVLVTSESKFSHLGALLSQNIKFAFQPFQYAVNCDDLWIRTNSKGMFDELHFQRLWKWKEQTWRPPDGHYSPSPHP
uniref:Uncharacterized protein n=1 Tax=Eutreptiella gymnastica TaxID=73025 RepID=A0A7S1I689_9EUGL|mmetsp:Transcript_133306/g.231241  ORF Transcript_133306/g.231241 Transcript_133306/m.231241 type:complete len:543 (+) Transcript_133306:210-1838(+)